MSLYEYPLLIENYADKIVAVVSSSTTSIVKGPTGCGKSTFIPWLLRDHRVAIIEPRRIAVTSLYNTLAPHIPTLGYKMRFSKKVSPETTMCIYTDGAFLNEMDFLSFDYVIIDEVHERSVRTDILLSILRESILSGKRDAGRSVGAIEGDDYKDKTVPAPPGSKCKLILMSATVDVESLANFFRARTLNIPGKNNPLEIRYLEKPTSDYIVEAYMRVKSILKERPEGEKKDILVFLPGEEDINDLFVLCKRIPGIEVLKIFSGMGDSMQMKIYEDSPLTRVILSTNICETSLTIPNVKYVIDSGLCKVKIYDGISRLGIEEISRESAEQRAGRCNRLGPGVCYRLFPEFCLLKSEVPEIMRCDLATPLLLLLRLEKNIFHLKLLSYPSISNVILGLEYLLEIGCIELCYKKRALSSGNTNNGGADNAVNKSLGGTDDIHNIIYADNAGSTPFADYCSLIKDLSFKITKYGNRISFHPFDAQLAHFYELCIASNVGYYGSLILSLISQDNYTFLSPGHKPDVLALIDLHEAYIAADDKNRFCSSNRVPARGMEIAGKMMKTLNRCKNGNPETIEKIFSAAFAYNRCERNNDGSYTMERNRTIVHVHPTSSFFKRKDRYIVVVSIFYTTKNYARVVGKYFP